MSRRLAPLLTIEFRQHDFIPGFAAFVQPSPRPRGKAFCVLNVGDLLGLVRAGDLPIADLPYAIADSMMHEVIHALEDWAGVEFSEARVEGLIERYRAADKDDMKAAYEETQETCGVYSEIRLRAALTVFADTLCEGEGPVPQPLPEELAIGLSAMRAAIQAYEGTLP